MANVKTNAKAHMAMTKLVSEFVDRSGGPEDITKYGSLLANATPESLSEACRNPKTAMFLMQAAVVGCLSVPFFYLSETSLGHADRMYS